MPNLYNKERYVVDIRTLDQALKHDLILKKVHRAVKFRQSAWLKVYIEMNTELRKKAKNEFEKNFFKLMNNSVFGKTMENVRKHRNIKLCTNREQFIKHVRLPNFKNSIWFTDDLMAVEMAITVVEMNKPVYLGQCILDVSKTLMYQFHYDYIKPKYGNKSQLCYMDTDSFIYHLKTKNFYKDIAQDIDQWFDTSNYDIDNKMITNAIGKYKMNKNARLPGLFKDEAAGKIIKENIALTQKCHAQLYLSLREDKKCKGIKKVVVEKTVSFNDYKECLFNGKNIYRNQHLIQHRKHNIFTFNVNKLALSRDNDKRIVDKKQISTLTRGHYLLKY